MKWVIKIFETAANVHPLNVGRRDYFLFVLLLLFICVFFLIILTLLFWLSSNLNIQYIGILFAILCGFYFVLVFVSIIFLSLMTEKRLIDAGYSVWNILWVTLPVVGVLILLYFLSRPSIDVYSNFLESKR